MQLTRLWKCAVLGTIAIPFAAFADTTSTAVQDNSSAAMPADQAGMKDMGSQPADTTGQNRTTAGDLGKGTALTDSAGMKQITGTISKVGHNEVWLNGTDGTTLTLKTDHMTMVYKPSGTHEKINTLKEGQQVHASYDLKADQPRALRIDIMPEETTHTRTQTNE